jgi:hypothetical protein
MLGCNVLPMPKRAEEYPLATLLVNYKVTTVYVSYQESAQFARSHLVDHDPTRSGNLSCPRHFLRSEPGAIAVNPLQRKTM